MHPVLKYCQDLILAHRESGTKAMIDKIRSAPDPETAIKDYYRCEVFREPAFFYMDDEKALRDRILAVQKHLLWLDIGIPAAPQIVRDFVNGAEFPFMAKSL